MVLLLLFECQKEKDLKQESTQTPTSQSHMTIEMVQFIFNNSQNQGASTYLGKVMKTLALNLTRFGPSLVIQP